MSETQPSGTEPRKLIGRSAAIVLLIVCLVLASGLGGAFAYYTLIVSDRDNTILSLGSRISDQNSALSALSSQLSAQNNMISSLNSQISAKDNEIVRLNSNLTDLKDIVTNLQNQVGNSSIQPYRLQVYSVNVSWYSQYDNQSPMLEIPQPFNHFINVQGFSSMTVLVGVESMSEGSYTLSIQLARISWYTSDNPTPNSVGWLADDNLESYNATINRYPTNWQILSANAVPIETKAPFAGLLFACGATTAPGWAVLDFYIYLRNG